MAINIPWQRVWMGFWAIVCLVLSFYFGYLYAAREAYSNQKNLFEVVGPDGSIKNSLDSIQDKPILGALTEGEAKTYGEILIKVTESGRTEVRLRLRDLPVVVGPNKEGVQKNLPDKMELKIARRTSNGLNFEYENTGAIVNLSRREQTKHADFPTILNTNLLQSQSRAVRLVLDSEDKNIFKEDNPDLPNLVSTSPAPYFWVNI